ncbi:MAG: glycosyltransferase [Coleofasciculaceae cyanobacterium SM2_3_26]|nr:glycosyltransferase [Coleofasciculaceae cyanobacterium SM2_3_26]
MKVLQIIPSIALVYGGPSQMVRGLSAALAAEGVEVTVLTTNANGDAGQPPLDVPLDRPVVEDGYQVRYFPCSPFRRYKFSLDLLLWLGQHAREYNIAHIHALFSPVSTFAATVARLRGLPYILRPLGTLDPADLQKKKQIKRLYGTLLERGNLAGAAAVHFTTQTEAEVSERFGARTKDLVIPLGVQLPEATIPDPKAYVHQRWGIPGDRPLLLFLSRIEPKKGLDLLLPALEKLVARELDFHFVLAGSNPQDPAYEQGMLQRLRQSTLGDRTTAVGFVRDKDKLALLQAADAFVLPSYYENFGIAVAEAMGAGTPAVISPGVYIWQEVERAQAGWVVPLEVEALANTLLEVLSDRQECQRRGENARRYAWEHYQWKAIAAQTCQAYEQFQQPL